MNLHKSFLLLTLICLSQSLTKASLDGVDEEYEIFNEVDSIITSTTTAPAPRTTKQTSTRTINIVETTTPSYKLDSIAPRYSPAEPFFEDLVS
jgi:hypothetical protein